MKEASDHSESCEGERPALTFGDLAMALMRDIESLYYVDIETGEYIGFATDGAYSRLRMADRGTDFFSDCQQGVQKVVYPDDWLKVSSALSRDNMLAALDGRDSFTLYYRLVIGGKPMYYCMKMVWAEPEKPRHIIVGVSNQHAQITEEQRLMSEQRNLQVFSHVARTLSEEFFVVYYVDVETDYFVEYSGNEKYFELGIEKRGPDFFNLSRKNIPTFTYSEDVEGLLKVFTKENVLHEVDENGSMSVTYRMLIGGEPTYVRMKATRLDQRHIVIGTSNVNAEVQRKKAATVKSGIAQALSSDYFQIFYVDVESDRFVEYRPAGSDRELDVEQGGDEFFGTVREHFLPLVCEENREQIGQLMEKQNLLKLLSDNSSYTADFKISADGRETYVHLKASRMADRSDPHVVIGLSNIDARVRREQAQAQALQRANDLANRDALTGVKTKLVFVNDEQGWDMRIENGEAVCFAVAVFDLNGLKHINDTLGHAAGDDYIRMSSTAICAMFAHSPVYRIGGDEFAAILSGADYEKRESLKMRFRTANEGRAKFGAVAVACGMSDYIPGTDNRFQDVFKRADADMYANKKALKSSQIAEAAGSAK